jgi:hypothetical protein
MSKAGDRKGLKDAKEALKNGDPEQAEEIAKQTGNALVVEQISAAVRRQARIA